MRIDILYLVGKMFKNMYKSGFSPARQALSGKFWCPVLSGQETHMSSPVEHYYIDRITAIIEFQVSTTILEFQVAQVKFFFAINMVLSGLLLEQQANDINNADLRLTCNNKFNYYGRTTTGNLLWLFPQEFHENLFKTGGQFYCNQLA